MSDSESERGQSSSPEILLVNNVGKNVVVLAVLKRHGSHPLPQTPPRKKREVKTSIIDHTYDDYSRYHITNAADLQRMKQRDAKCAEFFPEILHRMLSNPKYKGIICWQSHGRAWEVLDKERLISVACASENLRLKSFESFTRQGENS
jgi:hypothetical protein